MTEEEILQKFDDHLSPYRDGKVPFGAKEGRCTYTGYEGSTCVIGRMLPPSLRPWAERQGAVGEFGRTGPPPEDLPEELLSMPQELASQMQCTHDVMAVAMNPEVRKVKFKTMRACLKRTLRIKPKLFTYTMGAKIESNISWSKAQEALLKGEGSCAPVTSST